MISYISILGSTGSIGTQALEVAEKTNWQITALAAGRNVRLAEAPSHGEPIIEYDPLSRAAEAYLNLAKEVILRDGE